MMNRSLAAVRARHCRGAAALGFSLVELLVAITLGLFLVIGLITLLVSNTTNRTELDKSSRQIENGRYAVQLLSDDIEHSGFIGSQAQSSFAAPPVVPTACPIVTPPDYTPLGYTSATLPALSSIPLSVYGVAATPACLSHVKLGTARLMVTRLSTTALTAAGAAGTGETYVQFSNCPDTATDSTQLVIAGDAGPFPLHEKDCVTKTPLRKVIQRIYFVADCNVCTGAGADTTPTLKVAEYSGGANVVTPLVEGIENLQFDYGIDMNNGGAPGCYVSDPASPQAAEILPSRCPQTTPTAYVWTNAAANWQNVVAVRIHVLARNAEQSGGWKDGRTYDMGLPVPGIVDSNGQATTGTVGASNDGYKRHVYSAVARLYNVSGQRELQ
ncbi:type IV pilus assembly protein PilW [Variovorax sp. HW608]|nr:type IV pilus assembly protein PilW [Variovorax sp. HW608]